MMTSIRKTLVLACAVSVLGLGAAFAQTDPNMAPAAPGGAMAPAGGAMAPAGDASGDQAMMPKKKMHKKMMKKSHKKMMKKSM